MKFEVPQFVDVEDKIIGPFTWKQFLYIAGGGGVLFILYATLPFILFLLLGIPLGLFSAGLAFYKVNNRPLSYMIEAVVTYFSSSRLYLWEKEQQVIKNETGPVANAPTAINLPNITTGSQNNISSLARKLEISALKK